MNDATSQIQQVQAQPAPVVLMTGAAQNAHRSNFVKAISTGISFAAGGALIGGAFGGGLGGLIGAIVLGISGIAIGARWHRHEP